MLTRALIAAAAVCAALGLMVAPAAGQVSPPEPPDEVCNAIDDAGSQIQSGEEVVSDAAGEPLPASPGGNIRSLRYSAGCRFVYEDDDDGGPSNAPGASPAPDDSSLTPASADPATAPAAAQSAQSEPETLPVTGGGAAPLAGALLALAGGARLFLRRL